MKAAPYLRVLDSVDELMAALQFRNSGKLIEEDLSVVRSPEDENNRRQLDASVLSLVAANAHPGIMLDLGTFLGHSAARIAANAPHSLVYTINIHPASLASGGMFVTGAPRIDEIGSFYRAKGLQNVRQIICDTRQWKIPPDWPALSMAYIDACHDRECVLADTRLSLDALRPGGFILWHDFSPFCRGRYPWIAEVMQGVEDALDQGWLRGPVWHVRHSWIGIWRLNHSVGL